MPSFIGSLKKLTSPAGALLAGLLLAQLMATLYLYTANGKLYQQMKHLLGDGYLTVPNEQVMASLTCLGPAFFGGLFFTLTLGAGLALSAVAAAWIWDRLFRRKRIGSVFFVILWALAIAAVNSQGFTVFGTLCFVLIPPVVFALATERPAREGKAFHPREFLFLLPLAVLAAAWIPLLAGSSFQGIRDNLLGRNTAGIAFTEAYYRYTPYAAHALQPLDQRLIKSCRLEGFRNNSLRSSVKQVLLDRDYLPRSRVEGSVDLIIRHIGRDELSLETGSAPVLRTDVRKFLSGPDEFLRHFSDVTDRQQPLRRVLFLSLILASPLLLYLGLFVLFRGILQRTIKGRKEKLVLPASLLCLAVGLGLLIMSLSAPSLPAHDRLAQILYSPRSSDRVAVLRALHRAKLDIASAMEYRGFGDSLRDMTAAERYWLARTLEHSTSPGARNDLLLLADDPLAGVSYSAYRGLARQARREDVPLILKSIGNNPFWYSQLYAYRALRTLGWKQESP